MYLDRGIFVIQADMQISGWLVTPSDSSKVVTSTKLKSMTTCLSSAAQTPNYYFAIRACMPSM
jgi:hypothetical protein